MLSTKNDFLLLDATIDHAREASPENMIKLAKCLKKANPLKSSVYSCKLFFLKEKSRVHVSPLEMAIIFGSPESVSQFFKEAKKSPEFKNVSDVVLENLLDFREQSVEYNSTSWSSSDRISNDFYDDPYDTSKHLGVIELCILSKKWGHETRPDIVDEFWQEITSVCKIKNAHKKYIISMFDEALSEPNLRSSIVFASGLLKHLPSSWFKEVANFLIDTQKTLEMAQRRNENHANNREKCNIFSSTLGKKILTSNVSAQSKPTSAPRKM